HLQPRAVQVQLVQSWPGRLVMSMRERGDDAPAPLPGPSSAGERGQQEQQPSASAQAV
ncbi:hypothetical protein I3W98_18355, partial [Streptomyces cavourensis]|nr:hypothetical protein [Streptomyces cavourensis]